MQSLPCIRVGARKVLIVSRCGWSRASLERSLACRYTSSKGGTGGPGWKKARTYVERAQSLAAMQTVGWDSGMQLDGSGEVVLAVVFSSYSALGCFPAAPCTAFAPVKEWNRSRRDQTTKPPPLSRHMDCHCRKPGHGINSGRAAKLYVEMPHQLPCKLARRNLATTKSK